LSLYWLENSRDVVKTQVHLFCKLGGIGGHQLKEKWLEPQKSPEIQGFSPLDPQQWKCQLFCSTLQR